jgi:hypothetical protein
MPGMRARVGKAKGCPDCSLSLFEAYEPPKSGAGRIPTLERKLQVGERANRGGILWILLDDVAKNGPGALGIAGKGQYLGLTHAKSAQRPDIARGIGSISDPLELRRERTRVLSAIEDEGVLEIFDRAHVIADDGTDARPCSKQRRPNTVAGASSFDCRPQLAQGPVGIAGLYESLDVIA